MVQNFALKRNIAFVFFCFRCFPVDMKLDAPKETQVLKVNSQSKGRALLIDQMFLGSEIKCSAEKYTTKFYDNDIIFALQPR